MVNHTAYVVTCDFVLGGDLQHGIIGLIQDDTGIGYFTNPSELLSWYIDLGKPHRSLDVPPTGQRGQVNLSPQPAS